MLLIPLFILAGIVAVVALRYFDSEGDVAKQHSGARVVVGRAVRGSIEETLRYPGTLVSSETVTLIPKISGRVEALAVEEGDEVRSGQTVVRLEAEAAVLQADQALSALNAAEAQYRQAERGMREGELENARATLNQAEEDIAVAEKNFERSKRLYEAGTIAKASFEESESALGAARTRLENARRSLEMMEEGASTEELDMARANTEAAKARYSLAKLQLDYAAITSPVSGMVAKVFVDVGNMVGPGTALLAIVQEDPIEARVRVPEKHYRVFAEAGKRMAVWVSPAAYADQEPFSGFVESVAPVIDPASRTFEVTVSVKNPGGLLKPGMYANTEIVVGTMEDLLIVPESAVAMRDGEPLLFVLRHGKTDYVEMVSVELGIRRNRNVAVFGPVSETDLLVFEGNAFLEDGQQVEVIERK